MKRDWSLARWYDAIRLSPIDRNPPVRTTIKQLLKDLRTHAMAVEEVPAPGRAAERMETRPPVASNDAPGHLPI